MISCAFSRQLTGDTQFRWLGPEKGVIHLATAALINAVWDLYARAENKPLWQLLADMEPERIASLVDFHYINDALTRDEAIALLKERRAGQENASHTSAITAFLLTPPRSAGSDSATRKSRASATKLWLQAGPTSSSKSAAILPTITAARRWCARKSARPTAS